ncbi:MAG: hypothetical protein H6565_01775 [Lewinellaceae bacterium]|nr:hypothetical protein [Lewinellaceae bacterium]MCB9356052.1 hypothetical protein [Lewinellaceae bacterium]
MQNRIKAVVSNLLIWALPFLNSMYGQETECYRYYNFDQFLASQTVNPELFRKEFSDNLKYMAICRENNLEGDLEFLVFHHGDGEFEIIQKKRAYKYFEDAVNYAFGKAKAHLKTGIEEKFIATIRIRFDIEPLEESQAFEYDFIRTASKVQVKTIKSHD